MAFDCGAFVDSACRWLNKAQEILLAPKGVTHASRKQQAKHGFQVAMISMRAPLKKMADIHPQIREVRQTVPNENSDPRLLSGALGGHG